MSIVPRSDAAAHRRMVPFVTARIRHPAATGPAYYTRDPGRRRSRIAGTPSASRQGRRAELRRESNPR